MQRSVPSLLPGGTRDQRNGEPDRPGPRLALMTGGLNFVAQPDQQFRRQVLVADDEIDPALVAKSARTHRARMARRNDPAIYGLGSCLVGQVRAVAQPLKRSAQLVSAQVSEAADVRPQVGICGQALDEPSVERLHCRAGLIRPSRNGQDRR